MWSDSLHTTPPMLAVAGLWDEAIRQIEGQAFFLLMEAAAAKGGR